MEPTKSTPSSSRLAGRQWSRFPTGTDHGPVQLQFAHGAMMGIMRDESYGGLSVIVRNIAGIAVGERADVMYYGAPMPAVVRNISPIDHDTWRIGLEWADSSTD